MPLILRRPARRTPRPRPRRPARPPPAPSSPPRAAPPGFPPERPGPAPSRRAGVADSRIGDPSWRTGPSCGWAASQKKSRASQVVVGEHLAWSAMGAHGTPAASSSSTSSAVGSVVVTASMPRDQRVPVGVAAERVRVPLVRAQLVEAQRRAEARPRPRGDRPIVTQPSALRTAWYGAWFWCASRRAPDLTGGEVLAGLPDRERDHGLVQRDVEVLAAPGTVALARRGHHAEGEVEAADAGRPPARRS